MIAGQVKLALIAISVSAGLLGLGWLYAAVKDSGRAAERADSAAVVTRKLRNATIADDANTRCLADVRCRLSDDGYKRD